MISPTKNEQNSILVEREDGKMVLFCQIAGLVARRIVSYLEVGDKVKYTDNWLYSSITFLVRLPHQHHLHSTAKTARFNLIDIYSTAY